MTLVVVAGVLLVLTTTRIDTDVVLIGSMITLTLVGILKPDQALQGFASSGVMTIAALYVVVAGLRETGAMAWISRMGARATELAHRGAEQADVRHGRAFDRGQQHAGGGAVHPGGAGVVVALRLRRSRSCCCR